MGKLELNKIYQLDCLDGLPQIADHSVKLIIADAPYFQGLTHNGHRGNFVDLSLCKPFFKILFTEFKRILHHDGQIFFFSDWRGYAFYYPLFDAWLGCRNCIVWDKENGPGTDYKYQHEFILWHAPSHIKSSQPNVWRSPGFGAGATKTNGKKFHAAQKTLEITEKMVRENTKPGDLVVDPFVGSGTTAVVCRKLDRSYICFELDEENYDFAMKRADVPLQTTPFNTTLDPTLDPDN